MLPQTAASLGETGIGARRLKHQRKNIETPVVFEDQRGQAMLKANLIGNLGNDPEMRYSAGGTAVLRFNVASNYRAKNEAGEWEDKTEWVRCTVFGNRAETLSNHLTKGMRVYVDGRLEARPWTDNSGNVRAGLEVIANDIEFFSPRNGNDQPVRRDAPSSDLEDLPF